MCMQQHYIPQIPFHNHGNEDQVLWLAGIPYMLPFIMLGVDMVGGVPRGSICLPSIPRSCHTNTDHVESVVSMHFYIPSWTGFLIKATRNG